MSIHTQKQPRRRSKMKGTYKSTASASLHAMALIISGASVPRASVVPRWIACVAEALLRVLHPFPHVFFASEWRRIRGLGGWGGRRGRRAIPLLLTLPVRQVTKNKGRASLKLSNESVDILILLLWICVKLNWITPVRWRIHSKEKSFHLNLQWWCLNGHTWISCGASQISQRTSLYSVPGSLPGSWPLHAWSRAPSQQTSYVFQYPGEGPSRRLWTFYLGPAEIRF